LYGCSPAWPKNYISEETARLLFRKIKSLDCHSLHIGGGESFLKIQSLYSVLQAAIDERISIDYIETNSSWYREHQKTVEILIQLKKMGANTLLVSISPFHNEHIPFKKVKGLISACNDAGISIFPWVQGFYPDLDSFDDNKTHGLKEYTEKFGSDYFTSIPSRYWIHYGGRSLETFKSRFPLKNLNDICNSTGCTELADTSHFHFDLFRNYVPGLCAGLSIKANDLAGEIVSDKYPIISSLFKDGITGLLEYASSKFGFRPEEKYRSKCHLCFQIRKFLVTKKSINSPELEPVDFYTQV
jgi:hypothetical protein